MNLSILQEIPEFLVDSIAYCDNLIYKNQQKSCLVLTKCLKFYEFRKKECLHSIDLNNTCLAELKATILKYDGSKSKWSSSKKSNGTEAIIIGKYIYNHFEVCKLYLLILCWNKLVVLQRLTSDANTSGFQIETEFENVSSFKIVQSATMKYQSILKIRLENSSVISTDFQEHISTDQTTRSTNNLTEQRKEFKQLHERVRTAKAELQLHKELTQQQFESLHRIQSFGNNFVRSVKLEEKPMLSRCGDVWMRITCHNSFVLGVPLVNNCTPPNLTLLKNLCPILNMGRSNTMPEKPETTCDVLHYEHRLYQLHQTFDNIETLETFFQAEDIELQQNSWVANADDDEQHIRPMSFAVLVLKLPLAQLTFIDKECELFVRFDVEKDMETKVPKTHTFQQHLFIKAFDFQAILQQRLQYEIVFNEKSLHQDFLAVAATSFSTQLQIDFVGLHDIQKFENLLATKFDFNIVHRDTKAHDEYDMDVDGFWNEEKNLPSLLFYNRKPSSLWYGALVLRPTVKVENSDKSSLQSHWNFYVQNEEKTILMIKLLFIELLTLQCNIVDVRYGNRIEPQESKLANLEHRIRQELKTFLELVKNVNDSNVVKEKMDLLMKQQLRTDLFVSKQ